MKTVEEVRRVRLRSLREELGSLTSLNERLGLDRRDSTLSQIINSAKNSKTGKGKEMGSPLARRIEVAFEKPAGWMDTDPALLEPRFSPETSDLAQAIDTFEARVKKNVLRLCWEVVHLAQGATDDSESNRKAS